MPLTDSKSRKAKSLAQDVGKSKAVLVSLILPGVKPTLLGRALREACPNAQFHWAAGGLFSDDALPSADASDQTISFWAVVNQTGGHIIHGKEVMRFWRIFAGSPWITILGNPLWRAMDTYRNILQDATHPLHQELSESGLSIGEFYASTLSKMVRNRQSSKLVGAARSQEMDPESLFKNARQRLEHFAWVGLEGIDVGVQPGLARILQSQALAQSTPVLGKLKEPRMTPDPKAKQAIREANGVDFKLWNRVRRERFLKFLGRGRR